MWFWPGQAQNQVDSLIPLLYIAHDHDLQAAVDDVTEILRNAVARFDIARRNRPIWGYRWWLDRDCWRGQVHGQLPIRLHRESQLEVSGKLMLYPRDVMISMSIIYTVVSHFKPEFAWIFFSLDATN